MIQHKKDVGELKKEINDIISNGQASDSDDNLHRQPTLEAIPEDLDEDDYDADHDDNKSQPTLGKLRPT